MKCDYVFVCDIFLIRKLIYSDKDCILNIFLNIVWSDFCNFCYWFIVKIIVFIDWKGGEEMVFIILKMIFLYVKIVKFFISF